MKRLVQWSSEADDDFIQLVEFIADDNPIAAETVAARILKSADALGEMAAGRPGRVGGMYEKPVARLPYIIAYAINLVAGREIAVILRVIHGARDWQVDAWPK